MIMGADFARASGAQGQFLGLWRLIGDVGISGAPLLTGVLVDVASLSAAALTVAGIGFAGTVLLAALVTETLRSPLEATR
jgi:hypothetical protein